MVIKSCHRKFKRSRSNSIARPVWELKRFLPLLHILHVRVLRRLTFERIFNKHLDGGLESVQSSIFNCFLLLLFLNKVNVTLFTLFILLILRNSLQLRQCGICDSLSCLFYLTVVFFFSVLYVCVFFFFI